MRFSFTPYRLFQLKVCTMVHKDNGKVRYEQWNILTEGKCSDIFYKIKGKIWTKRKGKKKSYTSKVLCPLKCRNRQPVSSLTTCIADTEPADTGKVKKYSSISKTSSREFHRRSSIFGFSAPVKFAWLRECQYVSTRAVLWMLWMHGYPSPDGDFADLGHAADEWLLSFYGQAFGFCNTHRPAREKAR